MYKSAAAKKALKRKTAAQKNEEAMAILEKLQVMSQETTHFKEVVNSENEMTPGQPTAFRPPRIIFTPDPTPSSPAPTMTAPLNYDDMKVLVHNSVQEGKRLN